MRRRPRVRGWPWLLLLAPVVPAQVPAHAVLLNPSGAPLDPMLLHSGDTLHAVGYSRDFGGPNNAMYGFVHYARSPDGGRTWPVPEVPLAYANSLGGLAADGDRVAAVVYSNWLGPHVVSSWDGGLTWSLPVRVSQASSHGEPHESFVHLAGSSIDLFWLGGGRVWANRSTDGGASWQPVDTQIDVGVNPNVPSRLRVVVQGSTRHVFWTHDLGFPGLRTGYQRSLDGGLTWLPSTQVVLNSSLGDAVGSGTTLLAADAVSSTLVRSVDNGTTWNPVTGLGIPGLRDLAMDGLRVLVVGMFGQVPNVTYLVNTSIDGGATWRTMPLALPSYADFRATCHIIGDAWFVHFTSGLVIQSDDDGAMWRAVAGTATHGFWPSARRCIATTGSTIGNLEAYVFVGHTPLGTGTVGTGGIEPTLTGAGLPSLGRTFALEVERARGGSFGVLCVSFAGPASTPLGVATLWLLQPILTLGFATSGAPGAAGIGGHSLGVAVPNAASFAGMSLASQAFVLDPVAADGFTATRAIETWVR